ncbi:MAG: SsrA-binding protein SmpB [Cytophagales bacterium]|nr:SsrA-binding protein SmpB [Cytophagales bacterium]
MAKKESRFSNSIQIKNRKARYEYEFIDTYIAGMVLRGTEIKSLREGKASIQEAHCYFDKGELMVKGMTINQYNNASFSSHDLTRTRKLLLRKKELEKLKAKSEEKGLTIIPTRLFINDRGFAKLSIALARGKKLFDKRESLKKKDQDREMDRMN